jgi:hypothetical protein
MDRQDLMGLLFGSMITIIFMLITYGIIKLHNLGYINLKGD